MSIPDESEMYFIHAEDMKSLYDAAERAMEKGHRHVAYDSASIAVNAAQQILKNPRSDANDIQDARAILKDMTELMYHLDITDPDSDLGLIGISPNGSHRCISAIFVFTILGLSIWGACKPTGETQKYTV